MEKVTTGRLVAEVASRAGLSKAKAAGAVEALIQTMTEELTKGNKVELRRFAVFGVADAAPRVARNPRTGKAVMVPFRKRVKVKLSSHLKKLVGEKTLALVRGVILSVPEDDEAGKIAKGLRNLGYRAEVAPWPEGMDRAKGLDFALVPSTVSRDEYDTIARSVKFRRDTGMLPLVRGLKGEVQYQERPVVVVPDATYGTPEEAVNLVKEESERWKEEKQYFFRQLSLRARSDPQSVATAGQMIEDVVLGDLADPDEAYKTVQAFREAMDNAARHGNSGRTDRILRLSLIEDAQKIVFEVKDQGPGFAYEEYIQMLSPGDPSQAARSRIVEGRSGGLGIKLMAGCVDALAYSEGGTRLRLVKKRAKPRR